MTPWLWGEAWAAVDWWTLRLSPVYYGVGIARGRGQPVMVVPGFLATDLYMAEMHAWLGRIGYRPYFSRLGWNIDSPERAVGALSASVARAHAQAGQPVRLIGHSLGGLLARAVACQQPELVEMVISLGTPFRCQGAEQAPLPDDVRHFAIHSRLDAVVDWRRCLDEDPACNDEVPAAHAGLTFHPAAYRAIARRLAESAR